MKMRKFHRILLQSRHILYTPVARADNSVIVGYTHWIGDAFNPTVTRQADRYV